MKQDQQDLFRFLNWDNLPPRKDKRLCLLMYDIINKNGPEFSIEL